MVDIICPECGYKMKDSKKLYIFVGHIGDDNSILCNRCESKIYLTEGQVLHICAEAYDLLQKGAVMPK